MRTVMQNLPIGSEIIAAAGGSETPVESKEKEPITLPLLPRSLTRRQNLTASRTQSLSCSRSCMCDGQSGNEKMVQKDRCELAPAKCFNTKLG